MRKKFSIILPFFFSIFLFSTSSYAQNQTTPLQTITLKDGTILKGRLTGVQNNRYQIQTAAFGAIEVPATDVVNLSTTTAPALPATAQLPFAANTLNPATLSGLPLPPGQSASLYEGLLANPQIMTIIQEITQDPQLMNLLMNENLLQDVMSMDPAKIEQNPNVSKVTAHPSMKKLMAEIEKNLNVSTPSPAVPQHNLTK